MFPWMSSVVSPRSWMAEALAMKAMGDASTQSRLPAAAHHPRRVNIG